MSLLELLRIVISARTLLSAFHLDSSHPHLLRFAGCSAAALFPHQSHSLHLRTLLKVIPELVLSASR